MSKNVRVINEVTISNTDVKCPGCGATIKFDPSISKLVCPFCGITKEIPQPEAGAVIEEVDFNTAIQRASVNWGTVKKLIICANCGAQTLYDASQISGCCPFCGSTSVMPAAENEQIMAPGSVIPFAIDKEKADRCFRDFVKKKRYVPRSVKECKLENFVGLYLPFWTFDTDTISSYDAHIGFNYSDRDGDRHHDCFSYKGVCNQFIDDMVVYATDKYPNSSIKEVNTFYFDKLVPYSPEYLAGIPAERYTVGLNDAWRRATAQIADKLKNQIGHYELERQAGDTIDNVLLSTNYYNVKFRYLLAPMYLASYRYGKKVYQVAINGQTGAAYCDTPSNRWIPKLIIGIALSIVVTLYIISIIIRLSL